MSTHGFCAGTLVHTEQGLVPIQEIKVGDLVLSSPEHGNGLIREYKRVINTLKAESEDVYELIIRKRIYPDDEENDIRRDVYEMIYLTGRHPVYVENSVFIEGWDNASHIDQINARSRSWQVVKDLRLYNQIIVSSPQQGDETGYEIVNIAPVQNVNREYGFTSASTVDDNKPFDTVVYLSDEHYRIIGGDIKDDHSVNIFIDYFIGPYRHTDFPSDYPLYKDFQENYEKIIANVGGDIADIPTLRRPVYNFEVEEYHTYFVGEQGLWVHQ
ncbi:hypothetical protein F909_01245 [Acinetobacter sp. ANC 3929]|uniref:hypothetical protein n=1 Tax=unclassified Acinetobacter TaxID=196816 RepID=UPI0002CFFF9B|nr:MULTISPECIES: hypothetical protein [unclassified Acinetobacter]ENW82968.1 hypothetical protein F909_01245 [Acinetobacter sp. ANC 3929]MCH7350659.1 Hint domain-containing protein [Acinetobacter sp. NIPH 2023]MCH7355297.1 Hint domain-containing protein [Acinetobacter sp. NIPH 1958]MCH7357701.1 Hint domain-containing protein [Acinetobacter sp. NIPH 2024]